MKKNTVKTINFHKILMRIGRLSGCHQLPERSFFWKQYQFPVCARCLGVIAGYIVGLIIWFYYSIPLELCSILMAVMFIDWFLQYEEVLMSNNFRRILTGLCCGVGYLHICIQLLLQFLRIVFS